MLPKFSKTQGFDRKGARFVLCRRDACTPVAPSITLYPCESA